jgi:hypothetical protein
MPGIPEFREAVKKDDQGTVGRAGGDGVELDGTILKRNVLEGSGHGERVYAEKKRIRARLTDCWWAAFT